MKGGEGKMDRKTVEKLRRMQMKALCLKLANLIPQDYLSKVFIQLFIHSVHQLVLSIFPLTHTHSLDLYPPNNLLRCSDISSICREGEILEFKFPVVEVRHQDQNLEVLLISSLKKRIALHEVIRIVEDGGADVVNASFSIVGNKIIHTIHCQAISSRIGLDASKVSKRLLQLIR
ncbi:transcription factor bHLH162-like [Dendrobium catenatum]|uniref:transcription factor bHLH162-like n=1 Tax=Dendrobium catenatum TaxID=906689 RepID=UPI0010A0A54C|nr:transcription factor bHLH162-like [Dendrobium catenatum]